MAYEDMTPMLGRIHMVIGFLAAPDRDVKTHDLYHAVTGFALRWS